MSMFAKVFSQIFDSSIAENHATRHVFMDMLVLADIEGCVDMTLEAISRRTNVPLEVVAAAVRELSEPDTASRSPDEDGRRLIPIDSHRTWGWKITNYEHYRAMQDAQAKRLYWRDYRRAEREKKKPVQRVQRVQLGSTKFKKVTHAEGEGESDAEGKAKAKELSPLPESRGKDLRPTTEISIRIAKIFHRRPSTAWSEKEVLAYKKAMLTAEDLDLLEPYYAAQQAKGEDGRQRRDLLTFLNNAPGELDKATGWSTQPAVTPTRNGKSNPNDPNHKPF